MSAAETSRKAIELKDEGNNFFKKSQWSEALSCYNKAIQLDPNQAVFHSNAAQCLIYLSQHQKAIDAATRALELDSKNVKSLVRRATAFQSLSQLQPALTDLQLAAKLEPSNKSLMDNLAQLLDAIKLQEKPTKSSSSPSSAPIASSSSAPATKSAQPSALEDARATLATIVPELPPVPSVFGDFEVHWRSLQDHPEIMHQYLSSIDPLRLPQLLKDLMTCDMLHSFLQTTNKLLDTTTGTAQATQLLQVLCKMPRFSLLKKFFSAEQKKTAVSIFEKMDQATSGLSDTDYNRLKSNFV